MGKYTCNLILLDMLLLNKRVSSVTRPFTSQISLLPEVIDKIPFELPDEINTLREEIKKFSQIEISPWAEKSDKKDYFPRKELWEKFGDMGLHGLTVEEKYGGSNMGS